MTADIVSNNEIRINDGLLFNYGRFMRIVGSESVKIENGTSGAKRTDLIVARFTTNGTKETHTLEVIKGTNGGAEPSYNQSDIYNGTGTRDLPLYAVHLDGLSITSVERKCSEYPSMRELSEKVESHDTNIVKNVWSDWKSCGTNACGITLKYRYNEFSKLCEINWDGVINAIIGGGTMGYMWEGMPDFVKPKRNIWIPIPNSLADSSLVILFYPKTNNITANHFTITSLKNNIRNSYICGTYVYSYA